MRLIVLGDKSRYQFLRKIIDDENMNLQTEVLSEKNIEIISEKLGNIDNSKESVFYFSKKLPLHTTLFFPSEINMDTRYEINNKILFFDEFPYRTATSIENIKYILEKNPKLDFEIILIKNNRKNFQSDLSNEEEAIEIAVKEYYLEKFRVKVVNFEDNYDFLFWNFEGFIKNSNIFINNLKELKNNIEIFFEIEYEMECIQIDEKLSKQLLDSFVKYKESFVNKNDIMYSLKKNVSDYFFKSDYNYKQFFRFSEELYLKYIDNICIWNKEKDLKKLKSEFENRMEYFIEIPIIIGFSGTTEEDYIYFYNNHKKEMIEFKNKIMPALRSKGYEIINVGTDTLDSVDYPDIAKEVSKKIINKGETYENF